jgi:predicted  nucleic acid-binding Zn-ribbon protein
MNMQLLWDYQTADLALGRFEATLKKSKTRSRLLAVRNALVEEQNGAKKLDANLRESYAESLRIATEVEKIKHQMLSLKQEADNCVEGDLRQVRLVLRAMDDCNRALGAMYKQIDQIHTLAAGAEKTLRELRRKLASGKKEFDELKAMHDKELADASDELGRLREAAAQREAGVPAALLAQYKKIKRTRVNPISKVRDNQCGGCNMTIPSLMLSRLRTAEGIVECDSCGRILYYTDQE